MACRVRTTYCRPDTAGSGEENGPTPYPARAKG
nr:MAG TPA: hypothetical protein [Caudoviricetes sp.]